MTIETLSALSQGSLEPYIVKDTGESGLLDCSLFLVLLSLPAS